MNNKSRILVVCPNPAIDAYIWFDTFEMGKVNRIKHEQYFPGGKGMHVALALKELGSPDVQLLSFWSGPTGQWIKDTCLQKKIEYLGPDVPGWNRLCYTLRGIDTISGTEILGTGPSLKNEAIKNFTQDFKKQLPSSSLVCMSGSWPSGSDEQAYSRLINLANLYSKKVFIDCSGPLLKAALNQKPFAIHINSTEGKALFNISDPIKIALKLIAWCDIAAVTDGAEGLFLATKKEAWHARCYVENIISTVGCGDCLMAGLAWAHLKGKSLKEMAKLGVACGAANCVTADLGMINTEEVDKFLSMASVKRIEA